MPFDIIQYQIKAEPPPSTQIAISRYESAWHFPWSEPVRIKPGLRFYLQQTFTTDAQIIPSVTMYLSWWAPLRDPVRLKPGLRASLQHYFEAPPRHLPTPNVFVTLHATEINNDIANFQINVYDPSPEHRPPIVSIEEVGPGNSPTSIRDRR